MTRTNFIKATGQIFLCYSFGHKKLNQSNVMKINPVDQPKHTLYFYRKIVIKNHKITLSTQLQKFL